MPGTWQHRRESAWAPAGGARSCQDLSYFPLGSPGLGMAPAPSEHGGVVNAVTGGEGPLALLNKTKARGAGHWRVLK